MTLTTKMKCWSQQMIFRTWLTAWHVLAIPGNWKCMNLTAQSNVFVFHKKYVSQEMQLLFQYFAVLLKWAHLSKKYLQLSHCPLEVRHISHINESVLTCKEKERYTSDWCDSSGHTVLRSENRKIESIFIFSWKWPLKILGFFSGCFKMWLLYCINSLQ